MKVNQELFWRAYKQANEIDTVDCLTEEDAAPHLAWIAAHLECPDLIAFLTAWPFVESEQLCANYFFGPSEMVKWTQAFSLLEQSYLVIGMVCNGDFIVIPRERPDEIGFVAHETLDDEQNFCEYIRINAGSIGEFYFNSWNQEGFPMDYYDAKASADE